MLTIGGLLRGNTFFSFESEITIGQGLLVTYYEDRITSNLLRSYDANFLVGAYHFLTADIKLSFSSKVLFKTSRHH